MSSRLVLALLLSAGSASFVSAQTSWPRWRGASFDGVASTAGAALAKDVRIRARWKKTLGAGYSGIVIDGAHAVTMFSDGRTDFLVALDAHDGRERWRLALGPAFPGKDGSTGGPVSTPAIDGGIVFGIAPRGTVVAVDLASGKQRWTRDLVREFGSAEPHWGFTTSPLTHKELVIVQAGGSEGRSLVAFDRTTGRTVWTSGTDSVSYASPILATLGGREQIVAGGDRFLVGVDPADGRELWKYEHGGTGFFGRIINPVVVNGALLLTYRPDESVLLKVDGASTPAPLWTTRELKLHYSQPVVHDGVIYGYSGAFLSAVDAATGALKWRSRTPGDGFPIIVDGQLVVLTKQGQLAIAPASGAAFTAKATIDALEQLAWTPPSFAHGRIYVRDSYAGIAAFDVVPARESTPAAAPAARGVVRGSSFQRWAEETANAADADARVKAYLAEHATSPVIEGDRWAHILYAGNGANTLLRSDALGTGTDWPLNRVGSTDLYYASLQLEPDARIAYQFVEGLGDAKPDTRNPLKATSQNFAGEVSLVLMPGAIRDLPTPAATLRGRLEKHEFDGGTAAAAHLRWNGRKEVNVYLPPGYEQAGTTRFPVIYVLYGNELLTEGHLAAALDRPDSTVPPAIVVFVQNTSGYEYARTFRDAHRQMMVSKLVPWVDGKYRTIADAGGRILVGGDEAGFAAAEIGVRHPETFGGVIAQSLFPLSGGDAELLQIIDRAAPTKQRFHVDWGRYDPRRSSDRLDVPGFSRRVAERLRARGFDVRGGETNDGSTTVFWTSRVVRALGDLMR